MERDQVGANILLDWYRAEGHWTPTAGQKLFQKHEGEPPFTQEANHA